MTTGCTQQPSLSSTPMISWKGPLLIPTGELSSSADAEPNSRASSFHSRCASYRLAREPRPLRPLIPCAMALVEANANASLRRSLVSLLPTSSPYHPFALASAAGFVGELLLQNELLARRFFFPFFPPPTGLVYPPLESLSSGRK